MFAEEKLGTLEPGKVADLAVLSQDIFQVSNTELKTESVLTIVWGKIAYAQNAAAASCRKTGYPEIWLVPDRSW